MLKRLVLACAILSAIVPLPAQAQTAGTCIAGIPVVAFAHETITVSSTSIGGTAATYATATATAAYAVFTVETNPLRYWADGTAPTSTVGHLVNAGGQIGVCGAATIATFRMIRTGSDATVYASYYKAN